MMVHFPIRILVYYNLVNYFFLYFGISLTLLDVIILLTKRFILVYNLLNET